MNAIKPIFTALFALLLLSACTSIKQHPVFIDQQGPIRGYDPVAYFTQDKAVKGKKEFSLSYQGQNWLFASDENRQMFKQNPEKYQPQYGGYCAYAMSHGFVVETDPQAFTIVDDKLYLNYSLSVRETWLKDTSGYIKSADESWLNKQK